MLTDHLKTSFDPNILNYTNVLRAILEWLRIYGKFTIYKNEYYYQYADWKIIHDTFWFGIFKGDYNQDFLIIVDLLLNEITHHGPYHESPLTDRGLYETLQLLNK